MYEHAALILGLYFPGIDILKDFHNRGIDCFGVDCVESPGLYLRKIRTISCPDPRNNEYEFIEFIITISKKLELKPVLMITSDVFIPVIQKNKELLKSYYLFNISIDGVIEDFLSKRGMYERAIASGVPVPFTIFPESIKELREQIDNLIYPCIVKPQFAPDWRSESVKSFVGDRKVIIINNMDEMYSVYNTLCEHDVNNIIIQEIIPGQDDNLYYFVSYATKDGDLIGYFCGQKLRISPIHFGSASYMRTVNSSILYARCSEFLAKNKYWGPSGIEFKLDIRDCEYKLIEINARFGLWDVIGSRLGVNIFNLAYLDLTGKSPERSEPTNIEYYWLSITRDVSTFVEYRRENLITFSKWLKSLFGKVHITDIYYDEPKIMYILYLRRIFRKLFRR